jgi:hypothetical protein
MALVLMAALLHAVIMRADPQVGHWLSFGGFAMLVVLVGLYLTRRGGGS